MSHYLEVLFKEMSELRNPKVTTAASRHAAMIAEALIKGEEYPMLVDEPDYCGESIAYTVLSLWRANAKLRKVKEILEREIRRVQQIQIDNPPPHKVGLFYVEEEYKLILDEIQKTPPPEGDGS